MEYINKRKLTLFTDQKKIILFLSYIVLIKKKKLVLILFYTLEGLRQRVLYINIDST
jgi:hypothetical protein